MAAKNVFSRAALAAFLLVLPLNAQKIVLLPSSGTTVRVFSEDPLAASGTITANTGVFAVLSNPAGSRYFFLSSGSVAITDASGTSVQAPIALGLPIAAGAVTPDGRRLLVVAGNSSAGSLYIYDITLGTATQTAVVTIGSNPSGVTGTVDSTAALVVTAAGLSSVDLALNAVTGTVALPGVAYPASGVVGGPNGLFYVNAQGALYEVNPHTMTIRATIEMDAFPTKAVFSPDGLSILLANPSAAAVTQPALMVVDVATHAITSHTNWWGLTLSKLIWAPGNRLFAVSGNQKLAQFNSDLSGIVEASFPGVGTIPAVIDAFTSKELPTVEGGTGGKYLYVVAPATLYRIDLTVTPNVVSTAAVLSMPRTGAAYFLPVSHATPELTKFGDNQNVALTAVSLPLVVRAVDTLGRPVSGATVVFAAPSGTFVGQPMTTTNGDGLTEALIQAPNVAGAFLVSATVGGVQVWFNLTAGGSGGGGGGGGSGGPGPGGSGLAKYIGDGQVNQGSNPLVEPLTVILRDSNGNGVSNAPVTVALTGNGVLIAGDCTNVALATYTCTTDANGLASIRMVVPDIIEQLASWIVTNVTASTTLSDGTTQTVTFVETGVPSNAYGSSGPLPGYIFSTPGLGGTVTVQAGQTLANAIRMNIFARSGPSIGQGIPNIGIHMSSTSAFDSTASPPPVYCSGGTPLSGNDGWVTCNLVAPLTATPGTYPLWVVEGGNTGLQMNVVITAAPPVVRVPTTATPVSGDGQTGATGQALSPLVAVVKDQLGSPMPNITVSWAVISGSATLTAPTSTATDANGRASTGITLGATAGAVVVRMTRWDCHPGHLQPDRGTHRRQHDQDLRRWPERSDRPVLRATQREGHRFSGQSPPGHRGELQRDQWRRFAHFGGGGDRLAGHRRGHFQRHQHPRRDHHRRLLGRPFRDLQPYRQAAWADAHLGVVLERRELPARGADRRCRGHQRHGPDDRAYPSGRDLPRRHFRWQPRKNFAHQVGRHGGMVQHADRTDFLHLRECGRERAGGRPGTL